MFFIYNSILVGFLSGQYFIYEIDLENSYEKYSSRRRNLKYMKKILRPLMGLSVIFLLVACGGSSGKIDTQNTPPVAIAGQDQNVKVGDVVQLDAQLSHAAEGSLQYSWQLKVQPNNSNIAINDAKKVNAYFITNKKGNYQVELTVTDINQHTAIDEITVTVAISDENSPPIARITADRQVANTGQIINLNAGTSSDADNDPLVYAWTVLEQPNGSNVEISAELATEIEFTADLEGNYRIGLQVSDDVSSHEVSLEITLNNGNHAPVAIAGNDQTVTLGERVSLDGSGSNDDEDDNLEFEWSVANKPQGSDVQLNDTSSEKTTFTPDIAGEYLIKLRVSDTNSFSQYDQLLVTVNINHPPVAIAGEDRQVDTGKTVKLDGGASSDPEQDALTYQWQFIEKPAGHDTTLHFSDTRTPEFDTYLEGTYIVSLVVNDTFQHSVPDTITIESKRNQVPIVKIDGETNQNGIVGQRITFNGANSYDPEEVDLDYKWTLTTVENSNATLESDVEKTASFTPDIPGVYLLKLVVSDEVQESSYDLVRLTVYPDEEMVDVSVSGTLLDDGNNPLQNIIIYRDGDFDSATTDENGDFTFNFKVPETMLSSVELLIVKNDRIPKTKLTVSDFSNINTSFNIGQRKLPVLQRKDLSIWACDEYSGSEDVDISFQLASSQYDDMQFDYNETVTFKPRTLSYIQYLPATATIKMSSQVATVEVNFTETQWLHLYQENDDVFDGNIIDVCNKG